MTEWSGDGEERGGHASGESGGRRHGLAFLVGIPLVAALGAVLIGGGEWQPLERKLPTQPRRALPPGHPPRGEDEQEADPRSTPLEEPHLEGEPSLGRSDAPVTIVEFIDYQCPFCRAFHERVFPEIERRYIRAGKVRLVLKDFPIRRHRHAIAAAEAVHCAGDQDAYFRMHDRIFDEQARWSRDRAPGRRFVSYARDLDLDGGRFERCLRRRSHRDEIIADARQGEQAGVSSIPTFSVNGVRVVGPLDPVRWRLIIDRLLETEDAGPGDPEEESPPPEDAPPVPQSA